MDFRIELKKLMDAEETTPLDPLTELSRAQMGLFEAIQKTGTGISLQVEEVYDIVKEADENTRELKSAGKRESSLLSSLIAMSDIVDSLLQHMQSAAEVHAATIAAKRADTLSGCKLEMYDGMGERLDPRYHTVATAEFSDAPSETVIKTLESGYIYRGNVIRKATVIISKGSENA